MKEILFFVCLLINFETSFSQVITPLGGGTTGFYGETIRKLYTDTIDNVLYAGGDFGEAGGKQCFGIAKWNGTQWDSLGLGMKPAPPQVAMITHIREIIRYKDEIYVTGNFSRIGGKDIYGIARWNGTEWNKVGGNLIDIDDFNVRYPGTANGLEVYNDELYITGSFDSIGTLPCKGIAKWNGANWTDLSQNFHTGCYLDGLYTLKFFNNELYVAGNLNCGTATGTEEYLSKLVGTTWIDVGPGFNGDCWINKLTIFQNKLYIGGYFFTQAGNVDNSMVYTDGVSYFPTAGGVLPSTLRDMFVYKNELYVGGQIDDAGFMPIGRIAKWNGIQWINTGLTIESNINIYGILNNFAEYNGKLVMAGGFSSINGVLVRNIAMVDFTSGVPNLKPNSIFKIYPNPTNTTFTVQAKDLAQLESIQVYNALGQLVLTQKAEIENTIDVSDISKGLYMVEVRTDKGVAREKLMVE